MATIRWNLSECSLDQSTLYSELSIQSKLIKNWLSLAKIQINYSIYNRRHETHVLFIVIYLFYFIFYKFRLYWFSWKVLKGHIIFIYDRRHKPLQFNFLSVFYLLEYRMFNWYGFGYMLVKHSQQQFHWVSPSSTLPLRLESFNYLKYNRPYTEPENFIAYCKLLHKQKQNFDKCLIFCCIKRIRCSD